MLHFLHGVRPVPHDQVDAGLAQLLGRGRLRFALPRVVAAPMDEAIELARRFGSKDSAAFVNGVLDKVLQTTTSESPANSAN